MLNSKLSVTNVSGIKGVIETRIWGIWGHYLPWANLASVKSLSGGTNNSGGVCETTKDNSGLSTCNHNKNLSQVLRV